MGSFEIRDDCAQSSRIGDGDDRSLGDAQW
jgi:hypothetical protein